MGTFFIYSERRLKSVRDFAGKRLEAWRFSGSRSRFQMPFAIFEVIMMGSSKSIKQQRRNKETKGEPPEVQQQKREAKEKGDD